MTAANRGGEASKRSGASHGVTGPREATLMEHRVGRFSLCLPASLRRAWQEHMLLSSVHFREVPWTASNGYKKAWNTWLQKLAEQQPSQGSRELILEQRELAPRCQGVLAHDHDDDTQLRTWFALLDAETHGVWLECAQDPRAPEQALSRIEMVARSYRVQEMQAHRRPEGLFHLERGVVTLPPLGEEQVTVQFEGTPLDLRMELSSRPALEVDPHGGPKARLQRALAMGLHGDRRVTLLRAGPRAAAGFEGEELILLLEEEGAERLAWVWWSPGQAGDPCAPNLELSMHSSGDAREERFRQWDAVLESLRQLLPRSPGDLLEFL